MVETKAHRKLVTSVGALNFRKELDVSVFGDSGACVYWFYVPFEEENGLEAF